MHTGHSGDRAGVLGRAGSAGQEAFDSFARPLETGVCNCEFAVKPGDTAWTVSKASGATSNEPRCAWCGDPPFAGPESEGLKAQNRRNGAPQGALN